MAQVLATIAALAQMAKEPGLRKKVESQLSGIVEAALEIERLGSMHLSNTQAPLITRVDHYEVTYQLDVRSQVASILGVAVFPPAQSADRREGSRQGTESSQVT